MPIGRGVNHPNITFNKINQPFVEALKGSTDYSPILLNVNSDVSA